MSDEKKKSGSNGAAGCGILLLVLLACGIFSAVGTPGGSSNASSSTRSKASTSATRDNSTMAYVMMEKFVKDRLKAPATAEFPGSLEYRKHITRTGRRYRISSWVDAQNGFGALLRMRFVGEVEELDNDKWSLHSLEVLE